MEPLTSDNFLLRCAPCYCMFIYYSARQIPTWFKNVHDVSIPCKFSSRQQHANAMIALLLGDVPQYGIPGTLIQTRDRGYNICCLTLTEGVNTERWSSAVTARLCAVGTKVMFFHKSPTFFLSSRLSVPWLSFDRGGISSCIISGRQMGTWLPPPCHPHWEHMAERPGEMTPHHPLQLTIMALL